MTLPTPILDDRSYQQLRDELVRRIPVYNPEWTDHNASDPGITLVELFAFLGENLLFRFNQIPEATQLAFLRLLQIPLRPAGVARSIITVGVKAMPEVLVQAASVARAGAVMFETTQEVSALPLSMVAISREAAPKPTTDEEQRFAAASVQARGLTTDQQAAFYRNVRVPVDPSAPGATAVDFGKSVDGAIWLAALAADPAVTVDDLADKTLNIGFVPDEEVTGLDDVAACPGGAASSNCGGQPTAAATSADLIWQISSGKFVGGDPAKDPIFRTLAVIEDSTVGLTRAGVVRLRLPRTGADFGDFPVDDLDLAGTGWLPPLLDDDDEQARVRFWLRAAPRASDRPLGRVLWLGANATEVVQSRRAKTEFLGIGSAQPNQVYKLVNKPVIAGSLTVEVEENPGDWRRWTEVDDFDASQEDDKHFAVDLEAALVRFGNAVKGYAPQIGRRIRALGYQYGGGADGNVAAKALNKIDGVTGVVVANPLPARGGAPGETIPEALERVPSELRRRDRAVTPGDFQELALATPGADLGRAETLPLFCPRILQDDFEAAGVVSVVVWPRVDLKHPDAPMPDRTVLRQVCAWLDARRLVTTEVWVIPPTYRKVAVSVGLKVKPGYGADAVRRWVELVIRQYLAPLPPYGPDGGGWPLGRRVHAPELEAAALQVEGVEFLISDDTAGHGGVRVSGFDESTQTWIEGPVTLHKWEVPQLAAITVVSDVPPLAPNDALGPPTPPKTPIAIPVIKEEC
jgi:hypothetical protein